MRQAIHTDKAPEPVGPYSQAIRVRQTLYCSGQVALDPRTGALISGLGGIEAGIIQQTEQVCKNIGAVLEEAGLGFEDVVKTTCYLLDMDDFVEFNTVYATYFVSEPARSCVAVAGLPKGARVEIEVIAVLPA